MELRIEDLWRVCPACAGRPENLPRRASTPPGMPGIGPEILAGPCQKCGGRGGEPTPAGKVIAEFLDRLGVRREL